MRNKAIHNIFESYIQDDYFAGGVCSISINGDTIFQEAYGRANQKQNKLMKADTLFDLASITKVVTSTIILQLITEGKLSLETKLNECLPQTSNNPLLTSIKIKQLLTHSSGLKAWHPLYTHLPNQDLFNILGEVELTHKLPVEAVYSDLNFILLGEVIKSQLNISLQDAVQHYLVAPLQLSTLTYNPAAELDIAATEYGNRIEKEMCKNRGFEFHYWRNEDEPILGNVNDGNAFYFSEGESGHAGLFSDISDLIKIGELYMKGGAYKETQLIHPDLVTMSMEKQINERGLGWEMTELFPQGCGHTGFTGTAIMLVPNRRMVVGLLTNRLHVESPKNINEFRKAIFREILSSHLIS